MGFASATLVFAFSFDASGEKAMEGCCAIGECQGFEDEEGMLARRIRIEQFVEDAKPIIPKKVTIKERTFSWLGCLTGIRGAWAGARKYGETFTLASNGLKKPSRLRNCASL